MKRLIVVITPTADRPDCLALLETYLRRQTVPPNVWLIVDDGHNHAPTPDWNRCFHWMRERTDDGPRSLAGNIIGACKVIESRLQDGVEVDMIVIAEDDDHYSPDHIETCKARLDAHPHALATGSTTQRYYHLPSRRYRIMQNIGSALCNTALRVEVLPLLRRAAETAYTTNSRGVDRLFWESIKPHWDTHTIDTVVGIKHGNGLGIGHRPGNGWTHDKDGAQLRTWVGADAGNYL